MKLLIVDDSSMMRTLIEYYLSDFEFNIVGQAMDGVSALQLFESEMPEIVTLDITMPEMDGLECLEKMLEINPKVIIVMITALADKATGLMALTNGAKAFLIKPVSHEKLVDVFNKLLKRDIYVSQREN